MAKVQFSTAVGDMRNKVGGAVFTKGRFGPFVRTKVSPVQPRSSYQMNVRANFTSLSKLWSDATMDTYRAGWIGLADSYPLRDVFGNSHKLTGHQMFVRLNRAMATIGNVPILPPPTSLSVPYPGVLTPVHDGPPVTALTLAPATALAATEKAIVFATPGISPGRATAGARFRFLKYMTSVDASPWALLVAYTAKFGAPITGRTIYFRVQYVNNSTGAQSLPSQVAITI
jgi:hypothetical protein